MSESDRLRAMLDKLGVKWWTSDEDHNTHWESRGLTWEYFNDENGDAWLGFLGVHESDVTPEQAIAATLGDTQDEHLLGVTERQDEQIAELQKALNKSAGNWARADQRAKALESLVREMFDTMRGCVEYRDCEWCEEHGCECVFVADEFEKRMKALGVM